MCTLFALSISNATARSRVFPHARAPTPPPLLGAHDLIAAGASCIACARAAFANGTTLSKEDVHLRFILTAQAKQFVLPMFRQSRRRDYSCHALLFSGNLHKRSRSFACLSTASFSFAYSPFLEREDTDAANHDSEAKHRNFVTHKDHAQHDHKHLLLAQLRRQGRNVCKPTNADIARGAHTLTIAATLADTAVVTPVSSISERRSRKAITALPAIHAVSSLLAEARRAIKLR